MQNNLYEFVEIENIDVIKNELIELGKIKSPKKNKNIFKSDLTNTCPTLYNFLEKSPSTYTCKFYFTKTNDGMMPHIDGHKDLGWGLNIPVSNYEDSETLFYSCDESNMQHSNYDFNTKKSNIKGKMNPYHAQYMYAKDLNKLTIIEKFCMDKPCIFNTSVMHSMKNYNDMTRIMFLARFHTHNSYDEIKEWI